MAQTLVFSTTSSEFLSQSIESLGTCSKLIIDKRYIILDALLLCLRHFATRINIYHLLSSTNVLEISKHISDKRIRLCKVRFITIVDTCYRVKLSLQLFIGIRVLATRE